MIEDSDVAQDSILVSSGVANLESWATIESIINSVPPQLYEV
jgi:hypothetical protein